MKFAARTSIWFIFFSIALAAPQGDAKRDSIGDLDDLLDIDPSIPTSLPTFIDSDHNLEIKGGSHDAKAALIATTTNPFALPTNGPVAEPACSDCPKNATALNLVSALVFNTTLREFFRYSKAKSPPEFHWENHCDMARVAYPRHQPYFFLACWRREFAELNFRYYHALTHHVPQRIADKFYEDLCYICWYYPNPLYELGVNDCYNLAKWYVKNEQYEGMTLAPP